MQEELQKAMSNTMEKVPHTANAILGGTMIALGFAFFLQNVRYIPDEWNTLRYKED